MIMFNKEYDGESIIDLGRDIVECFEPDYNPKAAAIPTDEYGFHTGKFVVTVTWSADDE